MKTHEFERIVGKLGLKVRNSGDRLAWFEHGGKTIVRTKRSNGSGDLPGHLIRQQLKLNEGQFSDLIGCSIGIDEYISILKSKGLIQSDSEKTN
jgi:hypothetical protein